MQLALKNISSLGIWGLGIVGRSLIPFLSARGYKLSLCDARTLSEQDRDFLAAHKVVFYPQQTQLIDFLESADAVVPSGGVDLRSYSPYAHKWLPELDIFQAFCTKLVIAITGTLGKTTVTHTIATLLERAGKRVLTGGNIGVGLCDLLAEQDLADFFVLEVSSFQLEYCRTFAPQYAIWTNLHPNHLDRHGDMASYCQAKSRIFTRQGAGSYAFLPAALADELEPLLGDQSVVWCSSSYIQGIYPLVYLHDGIVKTSDNHSDRVMTSLPQFGFADNWLFIAALFDILQLQFSVDEPIERGSVLAHRIELVATVDGRQIYNDSKATIMQATLGAIRHFAGKRIHLLLGGLSKGVDRTHYLEQLAGQVVSVHAFGAEAQSLAKAAGLHVSVVTSNHSLEDAYRMAFAASASGDVILLSPGGSSFDLYANYQARGAAFVDLVHKSQSL